mgnify:CR=1 FL=1
MKHFIFLFVALTIIFCAKAQKVELEFYFKDTTGVQTLLKNEILKAPVNGKLVVKVLEKSKNKLTTPMHIEVVHARGTNLISTREYNNLEQLTTNGYALSELALAGDRIVFSIPGNVCSFDVR